MNYDELQEELTDFIEKVDSQGESNVLVNLKKVLFDLQVQREKLNEQESFDEMQIFRNKFLYKILQSEFIYYVFTKPQGYPGDFRTQEMIWNSRSGKNEDNYLGNSKFGKYLNSIVFKMENSKANIERYSILSKYLSKGFDTVASIGCGSGIEYWNDYYQNIKSIFFLDQDRDALDSLKEKANKKIFDKEIVIHKANILKFILSKRSIDLIGHRDLIYSLGFFDYFDVDYAQGIIGNLWGQLNPGGTLLISNAHSNTPNRFLLEWGGDWFLKYKSESQMHEMCSKLSNVKNISLSIDSQGVYQYLEIIKN